MKNTILLAMLLLPIFAFGQDKISGSDRVQIETEFESDQLLSDSEKNIATTLVDDRKYYRSYINFDLGRPHNLSFTAKNKGIFKFLDKQNLEEIPFEAEPLFDPEWRLN